MLASRGAFTVFFQEMKSSCIKHPDNHPLIIIRQWQVEVCDGDHCAAALMSFFEYWHNIKLEAASRAKMANDTSKRLGQPQTHDASTTQWHSAKALAAGLLGLYKGNKIAESIDLLVQKGFIRCFRNPNPRLRFDQTKHFEFLPDAVNNALESRSGEKQKSSSRKRELASRKAEMTSHKTSSEDHEVEFTLEGEPEPDLDRTTKGVIDAYAEAYQKEVGYPYPFNKRDAKPAQELAKLAGAAQSIAMAKWAWANAAKHSYLAGRASTIKGLHDVLGELQALAKASKRKVTVPAATSEEGEEWKGKSF